MNKPYFHEICVQKRCIRSGTLFFAVVALPSISCELVDMSSVSKG